MPWSDDEAKVIRAQKDGATGAVLDHAIHDSKVNFIKSKHVINFFYRTADDLDPHLGVLVTVRSQYLGHQDVARRGRDAYGEAARFAAVILDFLVPLFGKARWRGAQI